MKAASRKTNNKTYIVTELKNSTLREMKNRKSPCPKKNRVELLKSFEIKKKAAPQHLNRVQLGKLNYKQRKAILFSIKETKFIPYFVYWASNKLILVFFSCINIF